MFMGKYEPSFMYTTIEFEKDFVENTFRYVVVIVYKKMETLAVLTFLLRRIIHDYHLEYLINISKPP